MFKRNLKLVIVTAAFAGWIAHSQAHAELVYENDAPATARQVEDRATLHQNLGASERAQVTQTLAQPQQAQPVQIQMLPTAPATLAAPAAPVAAIPAAAPAAATVAILPSSSAAVEAPAADATANLNRSELLRRERVREEVKNEDILQERLEELRLQDEKRRADQILSKDGAQASGAVALPQALYSPNPAAAANAPAAQALPTVLVGGAAAAPAPAAAAPAVGVEQGQSSTQLTLQGTSGERAKFSISPRAGIASMASQGVYTMNPKYAAGLAITLETSDYLAFEVGYTYAVTGVGIAPSSPFIQAIQSSQSYYGAVNSSTLNFNNNIIDAGIKLYMFEREALIRPFVGAGMAYSKGFLNYDSSLVSAAQQYGAGQLLGADYTLSEYMASLSAGVDVKLSKNITLGIIGKYYDVLSSSQNVQLSNLGFISQNYLTAAANADKQYVGGSLAGANYFTVLAGLNLSF